MKPKICEHELGKLLRSGEIVEFNRRRKAGQSCDLTNLDLRAADLRGLEAEGLDLRGCYLRQADLRGVDFSKANLDGCSINGALISGVLFPAELRADEILLSHEKGTRMRYGR